MSLGIFSGSWRMKMAATEVMTKLRRNMGAFTLTLPSLKLVKKRRSPT